MTGNAQYRERLKEMLRTLQGATARMTYVSVLDQALLSGSNFVIGIVLARSCSQAEYGAYALTLAVSLFILGMHGVFITEPLVVLGPPLRGDRLRQYVTPLLIFQCGIGLLSGVVLCLAAWLMPLCGAPTGLVKALWGLAAAIFFIGSREFFRRVLFARLRTAAVMTLDAFYCAGLVAGVFALKRFGLLEARSVFLLSATVGLFGSLIGLWMIRSCLAAGPMAMADVMRKNWAFGRWNLVNSVAHFGFSQAETFVVAAYVGTAASGVMAATRQLVAPLQVFMFAFASIAAPIAALRFGQSGRAPMNRFLTRMGATLGGISAVYCALLAIFPAMLLRLFYRDSYEGAALFVRLWAVIQLVNSLRLLQGIGLSTMRRPDILLWISVVTAALTLGLSLALAPRYGLAGVMVGQLIGETFLLVALTAATMRAGIEDRPVLWDLRPKNAAVAADMEQA